MERYAFLPSNTRLFIIQYPYFDKSTVVLIVGYRYLGSMARDRLTDRSEEGLSKSPKSPRSSNVLEFVPKNAPMFEGAFDSMIKLFHLIWTQMQTDTVAALVQGELRPLL